MNEPYGDLTLGDARRRRISSAASLSTKRWGFAVRRSTSDGVGFFQAGACAIAVLPSDELANDANIASEGMAENFRGFALAWNCRLEHRRRCRDQDAPRWRRRRRSASPRRMRSGAAIAAISPISTAISGRWPTIRTFPLTEDGRLHAAGLSGFLVPNRTQARTDCRLTCARAQRTHRGDGQKVQAKSAPAAQ